MSLTATNMPNQVFLAELRQSLESRFTTASIPEQVQEPILTYGSNALDIAQPNHLPQMAPQTAPQTAPSCSGYYGWLEVPPNACYYYNRLCEYDEYNEMGKI